MHTRGVALYVNSTTTNLHPDAMENDKKGEIHFYTSINYCNRKFYFIVLH